MIRSCRVLLICIAIAVLTGVGYARWRWPNAVAQALLALPSNPATIVVSGNIEAHESVLSFTQVQAPIIGLPFDEGATIAKDTVLARVDDCLYHRQTDIDRANLGVASAQIGGLRTHSRSGTERCVQ
jgi:HlyD family secretion protein